MTKQTSHKYTPGLGICLVLLLFLLSSTRSRAQQDSTENKIKNTTGKIDTTGKIKDTSAGKIRDTTDVPKNDSFFLLRSRGLLGKLARSVTVDTTDAGNLQRVDVRYRKYRGRIIRRIEIRSVDFGVPINDTTRSFKNTLTRWADAVHRTTREGVIRKNLFFKKNDSLLPALLADNERHLRDQAYLNDAKIIVKSVLGTRDSVDITVLTKDVLSLGGRFRMSSLTKVQASVKEENFTGSGDKFETMFLYDDERRRPFGYGGEYVMRNIGGSFVDGYLGFLNFQPTFNTSHNQETTVYANFIRPLVNPYMKWTYALETGIHQNHNYYLPDTSYDSDYKYQYYNVDAWVGYNMSTRQLNRGIVDDRVRTLVGLRIIHREFQDVPAKFEEAYNYLYASLTGVLGSISVFRQNFYKTQYVYGFGRNEDVPEGMDISVTTGWTNKQQRVRPYMGLDFQFNYFSRKRHYFNYTFRVGGYSYQNKYEDISILANLEFFSRLRQLGRRWKQRTFITAGITTQINRELNEPLLLESQYGLVEYQNINLGGDHRLTVRAESVFFNDWSLFSFRFAPFVFSNGTVLTPPFESIGHSKLYGSVGAGLRTRNESLVFGTMELRGFFFPGRDFNGNRFKVEFNSNIKFKYNNQFIKRPQFITLN